MNRRKSALQMPPIGFRSAALQSYLVKYPRNCGGLVHARTDHQHWAHAHVSIKRKVAAHHLAEGRKTAARHPPATSYSGWRWVSAYCGTQ